MLYKIAHFRRGVSAPDGEDAVFDVKPRDKRRNKDLEQNQGQPVTHEIKNDQLTAGLRDIFDHRDEFVAVQVMSKAHRVGNISGGQWITHCIGLHDGKQLVSTRWDAQVCADRFHLQLGLHFAQHPALAAADIENSLYGSWVTAQCVYNCNVVAQDAVRSHQIAVGACDRLWRNIGPVQLLFLKGSLHAAIDVDGGNLQQDANIGRHAQY